MAFKRPRPPLRPQASSSSSPSRSRDHKIARRNEPTLLSDVKIHVVHAKLSSDTVAELASLIHDADAILCAHPEEADVLVTGIHMRKRLERHVNWEVAKEKAVVTPDWLRESVKSGEPMPCGDYVALDDLHDTSVIHCPDGKDCGGCYKCNSTKSPSSKEASSSINTIGISLTSSDKPTSKKLDYTSRFTCQRASPLQCPNQDLVRELAVIQRSRRLEGEERSALSYQRAIGVIKAYPHRLSSSRQLKGLPHIGPKLQTLITEYIDTGHIPESRDIQSSERFRSLSAFTSVYGIGSHTARRLYDLGMRSLDDLRRYYGSEFNESSRTGAKTEEPDRETEKVLEHQLPDELLHEGNERGIREALRLNADLTTKIPREEVQEMGKLVFEELQDIEPGCTYTICGGYRRGKPYSNDVDVVFTHPEMGKEKDLCKRLVQRLKDKGMVSHVMHLSGFHSPNSTRKGHWDTLEKALTIFSLPTSSSFHKLNDKGNVIKRQMDLICAPANVYWCAVVGWTGSILFERDLRQWTKEKKGMRFDSSGLMKLSDSSLVVAKSEPEVFELCGLEWIDPTMRNADA